VDLLVVAEPLPDGRIPRVAEFGPVEDELAQRLNTMKEQGIRTRLSPVFRTPEEARLEYKGSWYWDLGRGTVREDSGRGQANGRERYVVKKAMAVVPRPSPPTDSGQGG